MIVAKISNKVANTSADRAVNPYVDDGLYFLYYGNGAQAVAEAIFGPSLRESLCHSSENMSRKQIVPLITELLN